MELRAFVAIASGLAAYDNSLYSMPDDDPNTAPALSGEEALDAAR